MKSELETYLIDPRQSSLSPQDVYSRLGKDIQTFHFSLVLLLGGFAVPRPTGCLAVPAVGTKERGGNYLVVNDLVLSLSSLQGDANWMEAT